LPIYNAKRIGSDIDYTPILYILAWFDFQILLPTGIFNSDNGVLIEYGMAGIFKIHSVKYLGVEYRISPLLVGSHVVYEKDVKTREKGKVFLIRLFNPRGRKGAAAVLPLLESFCPVKRLSPYITFPIHQ